MVTRRRPARPSPAARSRSPSTTASDHADKSGTRYDFIEKKVVPTYEYTTTERVAEDDPGHGPTARAGSRRRSRAGGRPRLSSPRHRDRHGRARRALDRVGRCAERAGARRPRDRAADADCGSAGRRRGVRGRRRDRPDDVRSRRRPARAHTDRYLFYTAQRGLRDVVVQDSARFRSTFGRVGAHRTSASTAVRFNGIPLLDDDDVRGRRSTRPSAPHGRDHRPTRLATPRAATSGSGSRPATAAGDPVAGDGHPPRGRREAVHARRRVRDRPTGRDLCRRRFGHPGDLSLAPLAACERRRRRRRHDGGGGRPTTSGTRCCSTSVETDRTVEPRVTMHLSDDLTSWHVSASAIGAGLTAGEGELLVPVGLPFFADATIAPEYLVSDRPEIGLRAFGTALNADSTVTFAVDSDSLGLHVSGLDGRCLRDGHGRAAHARPSGATTVTITAQTGSGSSGPQGSPDADLHGRSRRASNGPAPPTRRSAASAMSRAAAA